MDSIFSSADIEEFRRIWREEFAEELTIDRARTEAESLVSLVYQLRKVHQRVLRKEAQFLAQQISGFEFEANGMVQTVPLPVE